jgi:hypothetical protein
MPTAEHEIPLALAKLDPDMVARLLAAVFGVKVPGYDHARAQDTDVRIIVPRSYRADNMVVFCNSEDTPLSAGCLEVQRSRDLRKLRVWKLYVASLENELDADVILIVFVPGPAVGRWYCRQLEADGPSSVALRPWIFTPDDLPLVVDTATARADPELAVFSLICHAGEAGVDAAFPAILDLLRSLSAEKSAH